MHDHRVALLDHPLEQLPYPSVAHSNLLGGLPLADASFLGSSQPVQLIPFLLAHRDSFHPLALRLSRGTFYFGQLGTSHFGATAATTGIRGAKRTCYNREKIILRGANMAQDQDVSRRDFVKAAGAVTAVAAAIPAVHGAPAVQKVRAANDQVQYGIIGTGSRGSYLLKHLKGIDNGRCGSICDINPENLKHGFDTIGNNPKQFKDYRELLAAKEVEAVFVTTPLFVHYPITKDALEAGKHVFCEKCLVFKPEEVHALRALYAQHPKQILQTGLQRRYSYFYQTVKQMVDKGILGNVHHIHAQWHRNMVNKPSSLWTMKPGGEKNIANWRVFRSMSGGLTAELTSHQVDIADWMFGSPPEFVMGLGSLDTLL